MIQLRSRRRYTTGQAGVFKPQTFGKQLEAGHVIWRKRRRSNGEALYEAAGSEAREAAARIGAAAAGERRGACILIVPASRPTGDREHIRRPSRAERECRSMLSVEFRDISVGTKRARIVEVAGTPALPQPYSQFASWSPLSHNIHTTYPSFPPASSSSSLSINHRLFHHHQQSTCPNLSPSSN